jgi:hypothetical protein
MIEIGREANESFERKFLGPRADLHAYMDMDADGNLETAPDDVARWKQAHHLGDPVNPRGSEDDVRKAIEQHERDEAAALAETRKDWQRRMDWQAGKAQAAAVEIPDSWVGDRIEKVYGDHQGGDRLRKDIAALRARLADGENLENFYDETNKMLDVDYARAVQLKLALAHVDLAA